MTKKQDQNFSEIINYLNKIADRINEVEAQSRDIQKDVRRRQTKLDRTANSLKLQVKYLRKASEATKEIIGKQKKIIQKMATEFKGVIKQEHLDRLKEKVDMWGPEKFVTRDEVKKNF